MRCMTGPRVDPMDENRESLDQRGKLRLWEAFLLNDAMVSVRYILYFSLMIHPSMIQSQKLLPKRQKTCQAKGVLGGGFVPPGETPTQVVSWFQGVSFFRYLGGGNSNVCYCHPDFSGNDSIWWSYVSDGLVQPPTRYPLIESKGLRKRQ